MKYTTIEFEDGKKTIHATDELGNVYSIPFDPSNSDYQLYLRWVENPNPVEHLTEIVADETAPK